MNSVAATDKRTTITKIPTYSWYVATLFAIFFVFSFVDRQIIGVLVEPMKADLLLSDLQLSYVGGLSFVIFYTVFGIPIGRLADTHNRKWVIIAGVVVWTSATAYCGFATSYWQLIVLRMGVGLGEAALAPCAYSILADMFPRNRLAMAISICTMGGAFGYGFAFLGGGLVLGWANAIAGDNALVDVFLLGELAPWRIVFLAVGLPGLLLSVLLLTVREPARDGSVDGGAAIPVSQVVNYMRTHARAFLCIFIGIGCINIGSYGASFWDIAFFERTYGWLPAKTGLLYGLAVTFGQFTGALIGGLLADKLTDKKNRDAKIYLLVFIAFSSLLLRLIYPMVPTPELALALIVPLSLVTGAPFGVAAAALQIMAPSRMRGQVTALYFLFQSLIGLGIGPTMVAFLTEQVFQDSQMLRYSLLLNGGVGLLLATLLFYFAQRPYQAALTHAEAWKRT